MKKVTLSILVLLILCSCQVKKITGLDVAKGFVDAGLPIANVTSLTAENDPNELLGRPNQYIEKVDFTDSRTFDGGDVGVSTGGTIEVFENTKDMQKRKDYLEAVTSSVPFFAEYAYNNGVLLLRLSHKLTPDQAAEYEKVFMGLK